jgi:hypothetical protein
LPLSPPPRGGLFSATVVHLAIDLVMHAGVSVRGAAGALTLVAERLALACPTPCFSSIRTWLLRLGCFALRRPLPARPDWVWLVDHTIQVEKRKLLIILGVPLAAVAFSQRCLTLADLQLIALVPMEHSTGARMAVELDKAKERTGAPRLIVADHCTDLKTGIATFQQHNQQTLYVHDVAHHGALVLQKQWDDDPRWNDFLARLGRTRAQIQQTELAALTAPALRMKARFMNVGPIVRFAMRVLRLLGRPDEKLGEKLQQKYGWLREYAGDIKEWQAQHEVVQRTVAFVRYHGLYQGAEEEVRRSWQDIEWSDATEQVAQQMKAYVKQYGSLAGEGETLVGSSEVLESCMGKLKRVQAEQSGSGLTGLALAVGAMVGQWSEADISQALDEVPLKEAEGWVGRLFGKTVQWMRRHLFHQADQA